MLSLLGASQNVLGAAIKTRPKDADAAVFAASQRSAAMTDGAALAIEVRRRKRGTIDLELCHQSTSGFEKNATFENSDIKELYIPLYINWQALDTIPWLPLFTLIIELEVVLLILSAGVNTMLAIKTYQTSLIHQNLKNIYFVHLMEYYAFFAAQLLLMCYQVGWIYVGFDTNEDLLLIVCGMIKLQRLWSACLIVPAAVLERTWASLDIDRYENSKKPYIGYVLMVVKLVASIYLAIEVVWISLEYWAVTVIALSTCGLSVLWLTILEWKNCSRLRQLESIHHRAYTLSKRYQLMENARVFKIIRTFVYSICFNIAMVWTVLTVATRLIPQSTLQPYIVLLMEYMIAATPIIVATAMKINLAGLKHTPERTGGLSRAPSRYQNSPRDEEEEATIYFSNLQKMWN